MDSGGKKEKIGLSEEQDVFSVIQTFPWILKVLCNEVGVFFVVLGEKDHPIFFNQAVIKFLGRTEDELLKGSTLRDLFFPEEAWEKIHNVSKTIPENSLETIYRDPSGRTHIIAWKVKYCRNSEGKGPITILTGSDVTDIKENENERALLAEIVHSSQDAIVGMDLNGTIISWNEGAATIYGFSADEILGRSILTVIPDSKKSEFTSEMDKIRKRERIEIKDTVRTGKDGSEIPVSVSVSPIINDKGVIEGASVISRDISSHKKLQKTVINYISEAAMRLKNPTIFVRENLQSLLEQVNEGEATEDDLIIQLNLQIKNIEQIIHNLRELNQAIIGVFEDLPEDYESFLLR